MATDVFVKRRKINPNYSGLDNPNYGYPVIADNSTTALSGVGASQLHVEKDEVTDLTLHTVLIEFNEPFEEQPIETSFLVYKMVKQPDNTYRRNEVPWGYIDADQPTVDGFEIKINSEFTPDLTGVIIKYRFEPL